MVNRMWAEQGERASGYRSASQWLLIGLAVFLVAALSGFFVFPSGKVNNMPTYVLGLLLIGYAIASPDVFRDVWKSPVLLTAFGSLVYLAVSALWSGGGPEELVSVFGGMALIISMVLAVVVCSQRLSDFVDWLLALIVISATLSAVHYFVTDSASPWGRLHTLTIAALAYGVSAVFAVCRTINASSWKMCFLWGASSAVLSVTCYGLGIDYVIFAMLTAALVLGITYSWRYRNARAVYLIGPMTLFLATLQMATLNAVLDANREITWRPVVDMIFETSPIFGHGILAEDEPGVDCQVVDDVGTSEPDCHIQHPHNVYIATMFYGGVIGLALLLLLVLTSLSYTIKAPYSAHKTLVLASLAYGFSVLIFDGDRLVQKVDFMWLVFWLPIALAIVLDFHVRDNYEADESS